MAENRVCLIVVSGGYIAYRAWSEFSRARNFAAAQARATKWGGFLNREVVMPGAFGAFRNTPADLLLRAVGDDFGVHILCWGTSASPEGFDAPPVMIRLVPFEINLPPTPSIDDADEEMKHD